MKRRKKTYYSQRNRKRQKQYKMGLIILGISLCVLIVIIAALVISKLPKKENEQQSQEAAVSTEETTIKYPFLICLDAGHGGADPGAQGIYNEKQLTLGIAKAVQAELVTKGYNVILTHSVDDTMDNATRCAIANKNHSSIFVAFHMNSTLSSDTVSNGVEGYYIHENTPGDRDPNAGKELSENILQQLKSIGYRYRGNYPGSNGDPTENYYVNAVVECTSCLIEVGFINNQSDVDKVTTELSTTAAAIADGIDKYIMDNNLKY